jgi:hypothetical protein
MYTVDPVTKLRSKQCPKCGKTKDETQWGFRDKEHTLFTSYCKSCDKVRKTLSARERFKDKDKRKKENFRQKLWVYGLTQESYHDLMVKAGHSCEICNTKENLVIDHCHDTKKVRGILCWSCNIALGHFKDSKTNLQKAMDYLWKNHNS